MALPSLPEIARCNVSSYEARFAGQSAAHREAANDLSALLKTRINKTVTAARRAVKDRHTNQLEHCAAANGMNLDGFAQLPQDEQARLLTDIVSDTDKPWAQPRIDFSNRYLDGHRLNYLGPYMGVAAGNTVYGQFCLVMRQMLDDEDVAVEKDSLTGYYKPGQGGAYSVFAQSDFEGDLLPFGYVNLMLSSIYGAELDNFDQAGLEGMKKTIEAGHGSMEFMTTKQISYREIDAIIVSKDEYARMNEINKRRMRGQSSQEEDTYFDAYLDLKKIARRRGISVVELGGQSVI